MADILNDYFGSVFTNEELTTIPECQLVNYKEFITKVTFNIQNNFTSKKYEKIKFKWTRLNHC